jgi:hypothetical protein
MAGQDLVGDAHAVVLAMNVERDRPLQAVLKLLARH